MNILSKNYLIKFLILTILTFTITFLSLNPTQALSAKSKKPEYEGYQIRFDYVNYPKERDIAYQYYLDEESKYLPDIKKKQIGIDLYDIDGDGVKEIFLYVDGGKRCPRAGCPFVTLRAKNQAGKPYQIIPWASIKGTSFSSDTKDIKILKTNTLGFYDVLFGEHEKYLGIWKWNGKFYDGEGSFENK